MLFQSFVWRPTLTAMRTSAAGWPWSLSMSVEEPQWMPALCTMGNSGLYEVLGKLDERFSQMLLQANFGFEI